MKLKFGSTLTLVVGGSSQYKQIEVYNGTLVLEDGLKHKLYIDM